MVSRVSPARRAAFKILRDVSAGRGEPAALLHGGEHDRLAGADRDLMTEITYGVLRWRNLLDFILARHSKRPLRDIDEVPLTALRIGLYQLRFLDRVPDRAAVDEAVRLTHAFRQSRSAPFVNAVLRNAVRRPEEPRLPARNDDPLAYLTTTLSHPEWLARRYLERLGIAAAEARCRRQNEPPPLHVRVSRRLSLDEARERLAVDGVASEPVAGAPRALKITAGDVRGGALFARGSLSIQDAGSQLVSTLVEANREDKVLDLCAAPGGKATALAEDADGGLVIALDRRHRRTVLLRSLAMHLGATNVCPVTADGARLPLSRTFVRILVDAPCSSLGTVRRNPDIKWRVTPDDLGRHAARQLELLRSSLNALAPGGRLVYATCSSEPEENEEVVQALLSERPDLHLVPAPSFATPGGFFQTRPESDDMDAFFAAILVRQ